ncbi:prolyl oligopeptidase family serine peptidase [Soonwooa sp.]|uniref:alpha/beta hydrolase family protein n=1 Tax=Soonwooa sp. TaxID=1938592 RepID=UPI00289888BD|nr:prolyl oligopeptidase family serine peptidase [Soonwooa sp.]
MKKILIIILLNQVTFIFSQEHPQKNLGQRNTAYEINFSDTSSDGNWLAVYKIYDNHSDSLLIVNREDSKRNYEKIGVVDYKWTSNNLILRYKNKTEIFDYTKNKSEELPPCESFGVNSKENQLFLFGAGSVRIYDLKSKQLIDSIGSVRKTFYEDDQVLVLLEKENNYELVELKRNTKSILYKTVNLISNVKIFKNHSFLIFESRENRVQEIIFYNGLTQKISSFSKHHVVDFSFANGYQRSDGTIILNTEKYKETKPIFTPEVWQSSETNFREKFKNSLSSQFLWDPQQMFVVELGLNKMDRIVDIDNRRYFLSFSLSGMQDYTNSDATLKLYRYDLTTDKYDYIDFVKAGGTYSPDGNYLIYKRDNHWRLLEINSLISTVIKDHGFFQPYFTENNKIYFDGSEGLWEYNIKSHKLRLSYKKDRGNYKILNFNYSTKFLSNLFELAFISRTAMEDDLLFEVSDKSNLTTKVYEKYGDHYCKLINKTTSKLIYKKAGFRKDHIFIEENYNLPKQLINLDRVKEKKVIFRSNLKDEAQSKIRIETVQYKNEENVDLKGILYYPLDYNPQKKYPLIVHVYQRQSQKRNVYPLFLEHNVNAGFNIRYFIEKGYFVYLPDIVNGQKGVGISALDCVHKSLDAIKDNTSIDFQKVGLIGHSFGGYVTNYISTHSNRFATYISGASVGDIVKSYLSMSFHFMSPLYWQFEKGQFDFGVPFTESKELYFNNNPISYIENVSKPILLWAGKKDLNVEWGQSMEFYLGLKRNNKPATMLIYPEEGHFIASRDSAKDLLRRISEWCDYYLKSMRKPDWIE